VAGVALSARLRGSAEGAAELSAAATSRGQSCATLQAWHFRCLSEGGAQGVQRTSRPRRPLEGRELPDVAGVAFPAPVKGGGAENAVELSEAAPWICRNLGWGSRAEGVPAKQGSQLWRLLEGTEVLDVASVALSASPWGSAEGVATWRSSRPPRQLEAAWLACHFRYLLRVVAKLLAAAPARWDGVVRRGSRGTFGAVDGGVKRPRSQR
jgi:hypothetical protein